MTWTLVNIANVCESIVDCINKTAPVVDDPTPYKMIRTTNVRDGWVDTDEVRYVDEQTYKRWTRRQVPRRNDVILTREAPLGEAGIVRTDEPIFLGQRLVSYRANPKLLDPHFLLYSFLSREMKAQILALGSGSTVAHMRVPDAQKLELRLPPLPTQRRIAGILSAYDDLIENNTKRIKILEEMARALYREWFVHFRFPGHENAKRINSPLGQIPVAWEVSMATDVVEVRPKTKVPREGEKPFVPMGSLATDSMLITNIERRAGNSGAKFMNGDTLFARITPCLENGKTGFVQFLPDDVATAFGSTEFIVLRAKIYSPEMVYLLARQDSFRDHAIRSMSGASGRQRAREKSLESYALAVPPRRLISSFTEAVRPMFQQIHVLSEQNRVLRETRDLLLPRLISGEIDVDNVDRPETAQ